MNRLPRTSGASLLETMVAAAVIAMIAGGVAMAFVAMQRNLASTRDYATNHGDEMRISDYLALDLRRALSVQISGTGGTTRVTLTIPNFYDSNGNTRMPTIKSDGSVDYRDSSAPTPVSRVTVAYYLSGSAMIREQAGARQALAVNVQDFKLTVLDSTTDPNAAQDFSIPVVLAGKVAQVKTRISFSPTYKTAGASTATTAATTFYNTTLLRNAREDKPGVGLY